MDNSMLHLDEMILRGYRGGKGSDRCWLSPGIAKATRQHEKWAIRYASHWSYTAGRQITYSHLPELGPALGYLPADNWHAVY